VRLAGAFRDRRGGGEHEHRRQRGRADLDRDGAASGQRAQAGRPLDAAGADQPSQHWLDPGEPTEAGSQRAAGPVEQLSNGAVTCAQARADLLVTAPFELTEDHGLALARRQGYNGAQELLEFLALFDGTIGQLRTRRIIVGHRRTAPARPQHVQTGIAGNRPQPRINCPHDLIAANYRRVRLEEGFLYGLLGVGFAEDLCTQSHQSPAMARHDHLEGRLRSITRQFSEARVGQRAQRGRRYGDAWGSARFHAGAEGRSGA
jgi:hypothetical protein